MLKEISRFILFASPLIIGLVLGYFNIIDKQQTGTTLNMISCFYCGIIGWHLPSLFSRTNK